MSNDAHRAPGGPSPDVGDPSPDVDAHTPDAHTPDDARPEDLAPVDDVAPPDGDDSTVALEWRGRVTNDEINVLHAEAFEHRVLDDDWLTPLTTLSLGWVTARYEDGLVGFVNVIWDGGVHAFVEDTAVAERVRRRGIGRRLIAVAREHATAAGCEWLHVDFDDHLRSFYFDACGFAPTNAGLMRLQ